MSPITLRPDQPALLSRPVDRGLPGDGTFGGLLDRYLDLHDRAVDACNADPTTDESLRLAKSERAAANVVLAECLRIARKLQGGQ